MSQTVADRLIERLIEWGVDTLFGYPGRQVVRLSGDGGFSMLMAELATIVRYHLPVTIVIYRNDSLGMMEDPQERRHESDS